MLITCGPTATTENLNQAVIFAFAKDFPISTFKIIVVVTFNSNNKLYIYSS